MSKHQLGSKKGDEYFVSFVAQKKWFSWIRRFSFGSVVVRCESEEKLIELTGEQLAIGFGLKKVIILNFKKLNK